MDESIRQLLGNLRLSHPHLLNEGHNEERRGPTHTKPVAELNHLSEIHRLRELKGHLQTALGHVDARLEHLREQSKATVFERGIAHLPNELLSLAFELGCPTDSSGYPYATRLSLVCKRFRNVALSTTRLWSTISSSLPVAAVNLSLERSRASLLSIILNYEDDVVTFSKLVSPHYRRWEELSITYIAETRPPIISYPARFPKLHTLRLACEIAKGCLVEEDDCDEYLVKVLVKNGSMPVLRTLQTRNIEAKFIPRHSITSMTLAFETSEATDWNLNFVLQSVEGLKNLRHLTFRFQYFGKFDFTTTYPMLLLPALTDLRFVIHGPNEPILLGRLIGSLRLPSLVRYSVDLQVKSARDWLQVCFQDGEHFPSLRTLHTTVRTNTPDTDLAFALRSAIKTFPQIRHLVLSFPRIRNPPQGTESNEEINLRSLQTLQFQNCHDLCVDYMKTLFEKLNGGQHPEKILMQSCDGLPDEFLREWSTKFGGRIEISTL